MFGLPIAIPAARRVSEGIAANRSERSESAARKVTPSNLPDTAVHTTIDVCTMCISSRCSDGTLYVGHANNVAHRAARHNDGEASRFTAHRRPVRVVYEEGFESRAAAVARERQIKRWTRAKKEALIAGDLTLLKRL